MLSPQVFEMLTPLMQAERLANSERKRLARIRFDDDQVAGTSFVHVFRGRMAQALVSLMRHPTPGRRLAHGE